jgi:hypothetical protein
MSGLAQSRERAAARLHVASSEIVTAERAPIFDGLERTDGTPLTAVGQLYVMSDRTGWWNLYRVQDGELEPAYLLRRKCGQPQWESGYSAYAFLDARQFVVLCRDRGEDKPPATATWPTSRGLRAR